MVPLPNKYGHPDTKPNIVHDYNNGMPWVDWSDQMLSYYQGLRRCIQWYKKIGLHILDIFLHNSFNLTKQQRPGSFKIPLLEYHKIAVTSLIGQYTNIQITFENLFVAIERREIPI